MFKKNEQSYILWTEISIRITIQHSELYLKVNNIDYFVLNRHSVWNIVELRSVAAEYRTSRVDYDEKKKKNKFSQNV